VARSFLIGAVLQPLLAAALLVALYYLLPMDRQLTGITAVVLVGSLVAVIALFAWYIRSIVRSPHPRLRAVEALATTLPLFLLLFSATYYLLEKTEPGSFTQPLTRTNALYFTVTVFSTVGFGDIAAVSEAAQLTTTVQMMGDIVFVGVAARIVVGAVQAGLRRQAGDAPTSEAARREDEP
jgi:hypothetical protein